MNRLESYPRAVSYTAPVGLLAQSRRSIEVPHKQAGAPIVHIGGDIPGAEQAIRNAGWRVNTLESLDYLLDSVAAATASCLIVDLSWSALENRALHERLAGLGSEIPFICTAEEVNLAMVVAIMKVGALDVLGRPVADETLVGAIGLGLRNSEAALEKARQLREIQGRYDSLSKRECEIMALASSGLMNKQIAAELGISEITVKAHRGSLMRKMQARSFASLVKMAMALAL